MKELIDLKEEFAEAIKAAKAANGKHTVVFISDGLNYEQSILYSDQLDRRLWCEVLESWRRRKEQQ